MLLVYIILNGLIYGLLLFLLSSGLTLIFSMMGVLNFAHASLYMLGAYFAYQLSTWLGFWPALILAPLLVGLIGAGIERYGLRPLHSRGHVPEMLLTFGLALVIGEIVKLVWGEISVPYSVPTALDFTLFVALGQAFPAYRAFMALISIATLVVLWLLLKRTRIGLIIQASLTHPEMVELLGHDVLRIFMLVFGIGSALAGLAGVIGGNYLVTEPSMAETLGTIIFVVIVIGGMGSLPGAFLASLLIGVLQNGAVLFEATLGQALAPLHLSFPPGSVLAQLMQISPAKIAPLLPYLLLVVVLIVRPRGLLGARTG